MLVVGLVCSICMTRDVLEGRAVNEKSYLSMFFVYTVVGFMVFISNLNSSSSLISVLSRSSWCLVCIDIVYDDHKKQPFLLLFSTLAVGLLFAAGCVRTIIVGGGSNECMKQMIIIIRCRRHTPIKC